MTNISLGLCLASLGALLRICSAATAAQATFASPEEAAAALVQSLEASDCTLFVAIAGPQMGTFWSTDNPIRDSIERDRMIEGAHTRGVRIAGTEDRKMLYIGVTREPFPAPLIRTVSGWRFDGRAGSAEVTARRIRRNETAVVELCGRIREAELSYRETAAVDSHEFAEKIRSAPGQHDGLYWSGDEEDESPLGPVFAAAAYTEREPGAELHPLFGYYFQLLSQVGGKRVPGGFAIIAWPAEYGVGGIRSFLITKSGEIFQRDLGPDATRLIAGINAVPDSTWSSVGRANPRVERRSK